MAHPEQAQPESALDPMAFLTSQAHVLVCLREDPDARLRDLASRVGVTERSVQRLLTRFERLGIVRRQKRGRRNTSQLDLDRPLEHPMEDHRTLRELIDFASNARNLGQ